MRWLICYTEYRRAAASSSSPAKWARGKPLWCAACSNKLPDEADVALILNPELTTEEFLTAITDELGLRVPGDRSVKALIDGLNAYLLDAHSRGRRTVLIVDEAQNLGTELLEQVRLLTNLETPKQKLLQIILIGQPELREVLSRADMRQVAQRVTGRYHLEPLNQADTTASMSDTGCESRAPRAACSGPPRYAKFFAAPRAYPG